MNAFLKEKINSLDEISLRGKEAIKFEKIKNNKKIKYELKKRVDKLKEAGGRDNYIQYLEKMISNIDINDIETKVMKIKNEFEKFWQEENLDEIIEGQSEEKEQKEREVSKKRRQAIENVIDSIAGDIALADSGKTPDMIKLGIRSVIKKHGYNEIQTEGLVKDLMGGDIASLAKGLISIYTPKNIINKFFTAWKKKNAMRSKKTKEAIRNEIRRQRKIIEFRFRSFKRDRLLLRRLLRKEMGPGFDAAWSELELDFFEPIEENYRSLISSIQQISDLVLAGKYEEANEVINKINTEEIHVNMEEPEQKEQELNQEELKEPEENKPTIEELEKQLLNNAKKEIISFVKQKEEKGKSNTYGPLLKHLSTLYDESFLDKYEDELYNIWSDIE